MKLLDKMVEYFIRMNRRMKRWQRVVSVLSAVIVFITTYALILPAITLDKDTALTQAGIEIADSDANVDENGTVYESVEEPAEEPAPAEEDSGEEDSSAESGSEDAVNEESDSSGTTAPSEADEQAEEAFTESNAAEDGTEGAAVSGDTAAEAASAATTNAAKDSAEDKAKAAIAAATGKNADEIELITEKTQLVYESEDYYVYADFGKSAGLPVGVKLDVKEITEESDPEEYAFYYEKALAEMQDKYDEKTVLSLAKFYDITFKYENVEIEPSGDVKVKIEYKKTVEVEKETKVDAVHFDTKDENDEPLEEEKAVVIDEKKVESERTETEIKAVEFESDKFSVYGIVYTVDFKWQVNGKTYEFSLPGGGFMSFEALLEVLGIAQDPEAEASVSETAAADALTMNDIEISEKTKEFVADVEKVEFSKPELVWVGKVDEDSTVGSLKEANNLECQYSAKLTAEQIAEINAQTAKAGDWALISVQPFLSHEALTVTMKTGEVFTIEVTDGQLHTYAISAAGDKYEIIVTYDDTAGIPEDAKLEVREILQDEKEYKENVDLTNKVLSKKKEAEVTNPVQFDIKIVANGVEVEPKEGSVVNVEVKLVQEVLKEEDNEKGSEEGKTIEEDTSNKAEDAASNKEEEGIIIFNGQEIAKKEDEATSCKVVHITKDGKAEIISGVQSSVEENKLVMKFDTDSFSDYLFDGNNGYGLWDLPSTIYVDDEIYMWHQGDYWVTNIDYGDGNGIVRETKLNNEDHHKTVTALRPGKFRICHKNDWNNGNPIRNYKEITVLPRRTGTNPPSTISTVDNTSIGLQMNLFDYDTEGFLDDYFNNYNHDDNPIDSYFLNHGINNGHKLKFWGSGIGGQQGDENRYDSHAVTSIVQNTLSGGYPRLNNGGSLDYLFSPSDGEDKEAYLNVNGLFRKNGDYYEYDSDKNYAYYDKSQGDGGSFDVYDGTYKQKSKSDSGTINNDKNIGFFPFHPWDNEYDLFVNWNKKLNHHFGLSMSVDFSLPIDPKAVKDSSGNDIIFEFSGDDDMWVFIDGKLAMDIGGVHQPTHGIINFAEQKVTVTVGDIGSEHDVEQPFDFNGLFDGNKHTLQVFYIERGGCDSNCKIKFNLTQYGDVECDKVDADDDTTLLPGAVFGLYKDESCTQPLMERLKDGTSRAFIAESDEHGHVSMKYVPLGTYYLKEISAPEGHLVDTAVHPVVVYLTETGAVSVKVTIDGQPVEDGVKITNKKPEPITLGLEKEWQNADGETISAPSEASATFELKRIRSYETITEETTPGHEEPVSKLIVGWVHNDNTHVYREYSLISNTTAQVSWKYADGYTGEKACIENGTKIPKNPNSSNVYVEAITMPGAGQEATLYIVDDSESGNAITSINVSGSEYIGNSGGGIIHKFETITEPDPTFNYDGANVSNNQVTLPVNGSWNFDFTNLPLVGSDDDHVYTYSYYLEEVSSESPEGTTVVYKDKDGHVISKPSDAETTESGTLTITNKVPTGYLRIDKSVTYNGVAPTTDAQKSALAGQYDFKVYTDENCSVPYKVKKSVDGQDSWEDLVLTVTIEDDGTSKSSDTVKIPIGNYWIEEQNTEQNPLPVGVTPEENRIPVTITAQNTTSKPAIASFTNNKTDSNNPDELAIELEKTFKGLPNSSKIPGGYQAALQYTLNGQTVTVNLTGSTQGNVTVTKSNNDMTWHWRITQIPRDAADFKVYENNYDITGYTRITKINGTDVKNPGQPTSVTVIVPEITFGNFVRKDYTTPDSEKAFDLAENQILLVRMTSQATVVVSQKSLSYSTRLAIEKAITENGGKIPGDEGAHAQWVTNFIYFSHEIHGNSFSYGGRTIFFDGNTVKIPHKSSSQEVRADITIKSDTKDNSFTIENEYSEVPTDVDVLKVEKGKETTTQLSGAVFELRQLQDVAPSEPGEQLTYVEDENHQVIVRTKTTGTNGRLTFDGLTYGYYEIKEKTPPLGFVLSEDVVIYLKADGGEVTYLSKGSGKPSTWTQGSDTGTVHYIPKDGDTNATFSVGNTPGAKLPSTGGPGNLLYTLSGLALIMASALMYGFRLRRRERRFK